MNWWPKANLITCMRSWKTVEENFQNITSRTCIKSLNILFLSDSRVMSSKAGSFRNLSLTWNRANHIIIWAAIKAKCKTFLEMPTKWLACCQKGREEEIPAHTASHEASGSSEGVACFNILLKAASFLFIFLASSFSLSRSRASAFSRSFTQNRVTLTSSL